MPAQNINQSLLEDAILAEVNYHRCRAGLRKLSDAGNGLTAEAKRWMDLVTSELFSATVSVTPKPAEFNSNIVPQDPRRGR